MRNRLQRVPTAAEDAAAQGEMRSAYCAMHGPIERGNWHLLELTDPRRGQQTWHLLLRFVLVAYRIVKRADRVGVGLGHVRLLLTFDTELDMTDE